LEIICKTKYNLPNSKSCCLTILALSLGPEVSANKTELDFGSYKVLQNYQHYITLQNTSPISAEFTASMRNTHSIFSIVNNIGVIPKLSTFDLQINCRPDDAKRFVEKLYIKIKDGRNDLDIVLKCKGEESIIRTPGVNLKDKYFNN
jgi:hypothetical protein